MGNRFCDQGEYDLLDREIWDFKPCNGQNQHDQRGCLFMGVWAVFSLASVEAVTVTTTFANISANSNAIVCEGGCE